MSPFLLPRRILNLTFPLGEENIGQIVQRMYKMPNIKQVAKERKKDQVDPPSRPSMLKILNIIFQVLG